MQGVLYVSHGTRLPEGLKEAKAFLQGVQKKIPAPLQQVCFLELASPTIEEGIEALVQKGATTIAVVPVLLLSAKHFHEDIPEALYKCQKKYPTITLTYGKPLGIQERLIALLEERIREKGTSLHKDVKVLLVGRGSHDPQVKTAIETIAHRLAKRINVGQIETCYLAACKPSFDEKLSDAWDSQSPQMIVVPYLWFNGLLIQSMQKKIDTLDPLHREIVLCRPMGNHAHIQNAFIDRVLESFHLKFDPAPRLITH
ncbi:sirohydrochlorin ferrochelatase [Pullulanibacillus pueri]|uniref:Sirohydrochlorin ferrochelatase n=1 Tax=Pullulanibacillus pueri TaxID=1437324 RepID=A0A8J3A037_9BACL|nr:sirohydrochlorin chelatase [Pullulanibacillus pueri]MBM7684038.1 sirohydrochlorin ferrochelatase [Pullulanibacillus pueri]GGH88489.1 sirohydrochlorin ferrochelatase [Pullulanibacillus pueri]